MLRHGEYKIAVGLPGRWLFGGSSYRKIYGQDGRLLAADRGALYPQVDRPQLLTVKRSWNPISIIIDNFLLWRHNRRFRIRFRGVAQPGSAPGS